MRHVSAARWLAARLERGTSNPAARGLAALWAACANPVRPVALPVGPRLIGVGGATLGGSGKTTLSAALAEELRRTGLNVAVVASGYRAGERTARRVGPRDSPRAAGDEAALLSQKLTPLGVPVYVAGRRSDALALAARSTPHSIIIDGLLQSRPVRLDVALLALDEARPWGAGACPPAGDLRAAKRTLWRAADVILWRGARGFEVGPLPTQGPGPVELRWCDAIVGARAEGGALLEPAELARLRLGLVLALARPDRVERELARLGVHPQLTLLYADHAALPAPRARRLGSARVDAWLTTAKCATKLGSRFAGAPLLVLEQGVTLPRELLEICRGRASGAALRRGVFEAAP
ncbi:MAG TPA: tetraacyldisaccharide 4'-kinase [Polyangiaceae bacterium]